MRKLFYAILAVAFCFGSLYATPPSSWNFVSSTGGYLSVIIPNNIPITVGSRTPQNGDAIGFFYKSGNTYYCAGYGVWNGSALGIAVWQDNPNTIPKDGFAENELMYVKIWDNSASTEYFTNTTYSTGSQFFSLSSPMYVASNIVSILPLSAPTLQYPSNGATGILNSNAYIEFGVKAFAKAYQYQVSNSSSFSQILFSGSIADSGESVVHIALSGLTYNTAYYWRARALNDFDTSAWASSFSFATAPISLSAPQLVLPANNSINNGFSPTLVWNKIANATSYSIKVSQDSLFGVSTSYSATDTTLQLSNLAYSTKYFWKVCSKSGSDSSAYSNYNKFTTAASQTITVRVVDLLQGYWTGSAQTLSSAIIELRTLGSSSYVSSSVFAARVSGIFSDTGEVKVDFNNLQPGSYWIVVRATGFLPIASSSVVALNYGDNFYDFSRSASAVSNSLMTVLTNGRYLQRAGDLNGDRRINATDYNTLLKTNSGKDFRSIVPAN